MKLFFYVIHSPVLEYRKNSVETFLSSIKKAFEIQVMYITNNEPNEIDKSNLSKMINLEPPNDLKEDSHFRNVLQNINIRQLSNLLKHKEALKIISEQVEDGFHIVIEDDIVVSKNICDELKNVFDNIKDFEILFLGLPMTDQQSSSNEHKQSVFDHFNILPCIDSYAIKPNIAKKLYDVILPFYYPTHVQLSYCLEKSKIKAEFVEPNIFADGSKIGMYTSMLNTNNKLFLNKEYNSLLKIAKENTINEDMYKLVDEIKDASKGITNHPDMAYLFSIIELKKGNIENAYQMMKEIYKNYVGNGCLLNNESEFLRIFIDMHKYIQ